MFAHFENAQKRSVIFLRLGYDDECYLISRSSRVISVSISIAHSHISIANILRLFFALNVRYTITKALLRNASPR